jgi:6-phosphogluconolactonase (cycloisomerase 2 family)
MKANLSSLAFAFLAATQWAGSGNAQIPSDNPAGSQAVYAMTNDAADNRILVYSRNSNGLLTFQRSVSTHGRGSGGMIDPLESQGSVALSQDGTFLFTANSGSGTITTFRVVPSGLAFINEAASGGAEPISISIQGDLLYVLNTASITGFQIEKNGKLTAIPSSTRFLEQIGGRDLGASDIAFSPDGKFLAITERLANQIVLFPIGADGTAGTPVANNSNGNMPFSCAFTQNGFLVVSEAAGGPGGSSAASSYSLATGGTLQVISGSVPTEGSAACWNVVTKDGKFGVISNSGSSSESVFLISSTGQLSFHSNTSAGSNTTPLDVALTGDGLFVYTLDAGAGSISEFRLDESTETLTLIGTISDGLTANSGMEGLAAH